mmetsp:Transcript_50494/g.83675  ORF Transcript_50494/g.83675 Transcript_50494/m.83675 type:complete len:204 (-) Transcript_50494:117-728(-)
MPGAKLFDLLVRDSAWAICSDVARKTSTYRDPIVERSFERAASAISSVPNSTYASPFGRPLPPSTIWMPWMPLGTVYPWKNCSTDSVVALNGKPRRRTKPFDPVTLSPCQVGALPFAPWPGGCVDGGGVVVDWFISASLDKNTSTYRLPRWRWLRTCTAVSAMSSGSSTNASPLLRPEALKAKSTRCIEMAPPGALENHCATS